MGTITKAADVQIHDRGDYHYMRYGRHTPDMPRDFLRIVINGRHGTRLLEQGLRNYYVVKGGGSFTIADKTSPVYYGDLITICPGETYAYEGEMELIEYNIDLGNGVAHKDME